MDTLYAEKLLTSNISMTNYEYIFNVLHWFLMLVSYVSLNCISFYMVCQISVFMSKAII